MLAWLTIQGLALVESVEIEFDRGLNVLTGETGAGKSLILGSVGLLLGDRADAAWLRAGAARGSVEGTFDLSSRPDLAEALKAEEIETEEGRLVLRREILADGKSRAFVNGRSVLLSRLRAVGEILVDLHGQHEHQQLLMPERQADFFDGWAGLLSERRALDAERSTILVAQSELRRAREQWEKDRADEAAVREDWEELRQAALNPGEEERLRADRERLQHRERIARGLAEARAALGDEDLGAESALRRASRSLHGIAGLDPAIESVSTEAEQAIETLRALYARVEAEEERLAEGAIDLDQLEGRLDRIHRLKRKHRTDVEGLLALQTELEARVVGFDPAGKDLAAAERALDERLPAFERRLDALAGHRADRFEAFHREVGARLARLGFGRAALRVGAVQAGAGRAAVDPTAIPSLEFAFRPNPGEMERPLRRIASGGELSRVMLAIKSLMAERDRVAVMVFDEVDQGIGGAVGEEVGRLLRNLGEHRQVLCITHLPLIAAHGARHFVVSKSVRAGRTSTAVSPVADADRVEEVARLLAGARASDTTRRQARELLRSAQEPPEDAVIVEKPRKRAGARRT